QFRNKVDNKQCVWAECRLDGVAPGAQLCFTLSQKRADKALKSLRQGGERDVAFVLVELARGKKAARWNERFVELIDDGRLTDTGISGDEHQFRRASRYEAVECGEQGLDFGRPPVQLLGDQQPVWRVALAEREFVDAVPRFPFGKAAPQIPL